MKWRLTVILLLILALGGCQNSDNTDAPASTNAHKEGWLYTHGAEAAYDHANCKVCHNSYSALQLLCTNCHVLDPLDPLLSPSNCVSCHGPLSGGQPLKPLELAEQVGRTDLASNPAFQAFTNKIVAGMQRDPSYVKINPSNPQSGYYFEPDIFTDYSSADYSANRSSHLHHDMLACEYRQNNATCIICHPGSNNSRHHNLIFSKGLGCLKCHQTTLESSTAFKSFKNCKDCHLGNFCN